MLSLMLASLTIAFARETKEEDAESEMDSELDPDAERWI